MCMALGCQLMNRVVVCAAWKRRQAITVEAVYVAVTMTRVVHEALEDAAFVEEMN